jgi:hypothetical protein
MAEKIEGWGADKLNRWQARRAQTPVEQRVPYRIGAAVGRYTGLHALARWLARQAPKDRSRD